MPVAKDKKRVFITLPKSFISILEDVAKEEKLTKSELIHKLLLKIKKIRERSKNECCSNR